MSAWTELLSAKMLLQNAANTCMSVAAVSRPTWGHTITSVHYDKFIELSLDNSTAASVASASISARLDYINSILYGTSTKQITRLQRVQNAPAT